MTAARVRKRSIDFLVDENETPYKLRRSSSVIVSNSVVIYGGVEGLTNELWCF